MAEVCPNCGLPKELCVCETIAKETEKIRVYVDKRRFKKNVTVVANIQEDMNPRNIAKELKTKLACGGTYKDGKIELQGDHRKRVIELLQKMGFPKDQVVSS